MPSSERIGVLSAHLSGARSQPGVSGERKPKPSPYLQGNFAPVRTELTDELLVVTGILPNGLRGSFFRTGSNPLYDPLTPYHWCVGLSQRGSALCCVMSRHARFDGDGMTHAVRFHGAGKVTYSNKWVRFASSFLSRVTQLCIRDPSRQRFVPLRGGDNLQAALAR